MQRIFFAITVIFLLVSPIRVCSIGLPPGTQIHLQATGQYTNVFEESQTSAPADLTLTVMQVAKVEIDWDVPDVATVQGEYSYFPLTITNTGNGTDTFALTASSANGWDVDFIYDDDDDGIHDDTETWVITQVGPMVSDGYSPCFLRVLIPEGSSEDDTVIVTAISAYDASQGTDSVAIHVPEPGVKATKLTASASPESPYIGQTVVLTGSLQPAMSQPITLTLVNPEGGVTQSSLTTDADGSYEMSFEAGLVGTYEIAIAFEGTEAYDACSETITVTVQEKIATSIDVTCSPAAPTVDDTVTVTGTLTPATQADVDLTCIMPSGSSTQHHLTTDANGIFTWQTTISSEGQWYFQADYAGDDSHASCSKLLAVQVTVPVVTEHTVNISAGPVLTPSAVDSLGSTQCSVTAVDSEDHQILYSWSDNGAGGSFSPSAEARLPVYTASANDTGQDIKITLTCTATCAEDTQVSDSNSTNLTVYAVDVTAPVVISASPSNGAQCVGLSANIVVKFSKAMDRTSTQTAVNLTPALSSEQYSWSADSKTLTISHANMTPGTDYIAAVTTSALDSNSTAMEQDYVWGFTTTSGAWFNPNDMSVQTDAEFVTGSLVLNASEATTFTAFVGVPEGIDVDTAISGDSLACIEAGDDVASLTSSWDPNGREIAITAEISNPSANTEIIKGITLTAPSNSGTSYITIDGCGALKVTFVGPLPGDFNSDGAVDITDAADFITEWIRWHGVAAPVWSDEIDAVFDLAPYSDGVWPDWTPIGDGAIDIMDASAFIDCWIGSHVSGGLASVSSYVPVNRSRSYVYLTASADIVVTVEDAPSGVFEVEVELPDGAWFIPALDEYGNLRNVVREVGNGGMLFSEYDRNRNTVRLAGNVCGMAPYTVAVIHLGR